MFFRDNSKVKNRPLGHSSPIDHRQIADSARDAGHWALAARHYREMLKENPKDVGIWLQHGHMLKELGLFGDAAESYGRALSLAPNDPESHLQCGFLAKITGDLPLALHHLRQARELGYQPIDLVDQEIRLCAGRRSISVLSASSNKKRLPLRVYLSSITGLPFDESGAELQQRLGAAHYSYAFAMKGMVAALEMLEIPHVVIRNPEFVPDIAERSDAEINIHIGFYPPEDVRFLKGAYNILSVAWEFERLKNTVEAVSYHAFADPLRMLGRADEIWSVSAYGAEALRRSGLQRVEAVPTPIIQGHRRGRRMGPPSWSDLERGAAALNSVTWSPLAISYPLQGAFNEAALRRRGSLHKALFEGEDFSDHEEGPPIIFLSVFNAHDYRKQIRPLIEAFVQYAAVNRKAYLLLKVTKVSWAKDSLISQLIRDEQMHDPGGLIPFFVSDRILITSETLTREQMQSLYDCAGFYVCTSHAEGQNLPMMEAMARGVVPISVDNTAMASYIRPDNAVVIPSSLAPFTQRLTQRYGLYGVSTCYTAAEDVYAALDFAAAMPPETYVASSVAAAQTIADQFGVETLRVALERITLQLKASVTGEDC
jgi:glycosyltransferase involved in cell wall biosynthesis